MRAATRFKRLLLLGAPLMWLVGCDFLTSTQEPSADWEAATDLSSEYGGYAYTDEQPAFGDPSFAKLEAEEATVAMEPAATPVPAGTFALRILWGQLRGNRDLEVVTDWSGGIAVSSGGVAVLHTIAFEMPGDHLLPRENRQELGFVSHTQPHFDGLLLAIHPGDDLEATLSFRTVAYSNTWKLSDLATINMVIPIDALGNAVALEGIVLDAPCPTGFVRGHWVRRDAEERGVFRGLWATSLGLPLGHIRGHFGVNEEGRVWVGKIIDREGRILGLARGSWEPSDAPEMPGGSFAGHWASLGGERQGAVGGRYMPAMEGERGVAGFFAGRWNTACGDAAPDLP